ncbi:aminotransferase class I/II-fold pyridoxal phosphate-dependent enzyme, partial [Arthrospira platensis SPKY1]|nr:aminotransferase class I/II-fold pyridoxal phosphate-dependent enzyme [Arthrospira platensis SPKY1]
FQLQTDALLAQCDAHTKAIFLCSPNNPTANDLNQDNIRTILEQAHCLVVIDEAYIDFTDRASWIHELDRYPNLVVLQTLSKAYGLAGLRLGMAFASPALISWFMRVKAPYNLGKLTQQFALDALEQHARVGSFIQTIRQEKVRLIDFLQQNPAVTRVWPSDA